MFNPVKLLIVISFAMNVLRNNLVKGENKTKDLSSKSYRIEYVSFCVFKNEIFSKNEDNFKYYCTIIIDMCVKWKYLTTSKYRNSDLNPQQ